MARMRSDYKPDSDSEDDEIILVDDSESEDRKPKKKQKKKKTPAKTEEADDVKASDMDDMPQTSQGGSQVREPV